MVRCRSTKGSSFVDFSLDELVEFLPADVLGSISTDWVDYLDELIIIVSVLQLLVNISEVVQVQISLCLDVQKGEVSSSSFLTEWVSLNKRTTTILRVSSLRNCSKSKAAPWVESLTSERSLKTNSYLWSRPRVLAVTNRSLTSALLCLGSA